MRPQLRSEEKTISAALRRQEYAQAKLSYFADIAWPNGKKWIGKCRCCGKRAFLEVHHTRGRRGALLTDTRHWLAVCRKCHTWIHNNPDEARNRGWLAKRGDWGRQ